MENWTVKSVDGVERESTPETVENVEQPVQEQVETPQEEVYQTPTNDDGDYVINLDKPITEDAIQERETEEIPVDETPGDSTQVDEEVREQPSEELGAQEVEQAPVEEFTVERIEEEETPQKEEPVKEVVQETVQPQQPVEPQIELPEGIDKLVEFMNETGGTVEDFINLNKDIDAMDDVSVIREYYKSTKPHYDNEDIDFIMNKNFHFDPEMDAEGDIRAKKLAFKEELFKARQYHNGAKEKYYADLKLNKQNSIAPEYQQAYEFYNEQQKIQEQNQKLVDSFHQKTAKVFNDDFKGFDFKVGDNKYRVKVGDVNKTMEHQKDLNNFINEFIGEDGTVSDAAAYHKAIYAARNADKLAQHFYEQGRADAIKQSAASAKNIDMTPRQDNSAITTPSGTKYKVVSGDSSSKLRIKMRR